MYIPYCYLQACLDLHISLRDETCARCRHIVRVRNLAVALAKEEGLPAERTEVVELAALLHDLHDWKYSGSITAGAEASREFLSAQGCPTHVIELVVSTIQRIGFKDELEKGAASEVWPELAVVQDADRLDAIGAIGIARCLTYGGSRNRVLHDPSVKPRHTMSKAEYMDTAAKQTTINHFPEKLLKLKGMMKTTAGRRIAEERHKVMLDYLTRFFQEWEGQA
uniref:HD domain-containing protein n=1 Tax=Pyramimonas obovata TaxID=1411642 RepID=A0A7S0WLL8_9CHLO|mmetsp:Transcript_29730/g.64918  ORF Transcript_29730/g.64918 Transcript_29730/m.64918 type:complete len:223 (+) Transcript_29730:342-1010(+)